MAPRRERIAVGAAIACMIALLAALFTAPATRARPDIEKGEVERIVVREIASMAAANGAGGVAVAVRIAGRTLFFDYGLADLATKRPITSDSLFNLGSVRKVFEAALVAQGAQRGELRLNDPVAKYVEQLHGDYVSRVTIGQLATHTSGLLLPTDHEPWPEQGYSLAAFLDALNAFTPHHGEAPGNQHIYSHAGYVLLQLALERRYGMPIAELIHRRVTGPLKMNSTLVPERGPDDRAVMPPQFTQRAVQGYSYAGSSIGLPGNQQSYYNFLGTGQMFSSARDLAVFLAASLDDWPIDAQMWDALKATQREAFRMSAHDAQAMAWEIINLGGPTIVDKPGGLDNAQAYMGLVPAQKIGLVILSNRGDIHPYEAARSTILPELARL